MVDTIKFSEFIDGGDLENNNTTVGLESGANARFNNPWTFLASGTTGERPAPDANMYYRLRFNTTIQSYEYYSPVTLDWVQLEDSIDVQSFPFVIYTDEPLLPSAFNLGTLVNGILKQTVALGVATPAIAINGTDYYGPGFIIPITDGGTGADTALGARTNLGLGTADTPEFANLILNGGLSGAYIGDQFGNVRLFLNTDGINSINYPWISNSQTGDPVQYSAAGADLNIDLSIKSKGSGIIEFLSLASTSALSFITGTGYQHTTNLNFSNTANVSNVTFQDSSGTVAWLSDVLATVTSLTGTANQVLVNGGSGVPVTGDITLTLPQDISSTSSPQFTNLILTGASFLNTTGQVIASLGDNGLNSVNYLQFNNSISGAPPTLHSYGSDVDVAIQYQSQNAGIHTFYTTSTATALNFNTGTGYQHVTQFNFANSAATQTVTFQDSSGTVAWLSDVLATVTSLTGTANQVLVNGTSGSAQTGATTFTLPQSIATTSQVQFDRVSFSDTTHGILGTTTNDDADTGYVGEYLTATATVALTTSVGVDVVSLVLTAGDWDVWGLGVFLPAGATWQTLTVGVTTVSGTIPGPSFQLQMAGVWVGTNYSNRLPAPAKRISISAPTTVYFDAFCDFTLGSVDCEGFLFARRRR